MSSKGTSSDDSTPDGMQTPTHHSGLTSKRPNATGRREPVYDTRGNSVYDTRGDSNTGHLPGESFSSDSASEQKCGQVRAPTRNPKRVAPGRGPSLQPSIASHPTTPAATRCPYSSQERLTHTVRSSLCWVLQPPSGERRLPMDGGPPDLPRSKLSVSEIGKHCDALLVFRVRARWWPPPGRGACCRPFCCFAAPPVDTQRPC